MDITRVAEGSDAEDQEKIIDEIVNKLRKIGDEFDKKDSSLKMELMQMMQRKLKDAILESWKEKLAQFALLTNLIEWKVRTH